MGEAMRGWSVMAIALLNYDRLRKTLVRLLRRLDADRKLCLQEVQGVAASWAGLGLAYQQRKRL